tara:strand:+ start:116 stop:385 length:270 start_codon:yes stop_codon:yes gene_type:complete
MGKKLQEKAKEAYNIIRTLGQEDAKTNLLKEILIPGSNLDILAMNAVVNETNPKGDEPTKHFDKGMNILLIKYGAYASATAYLIYQLAN